MNAEPVVTSRRSTGSKPRATRRVSRGIGVAVAAALLTSACAAGQQAQTADEKTVLDGQNQTVGTIDLRGIAVKAPPSLQPFYEAGTDALVTVVFVNNGRSADRLTNITTTSASGWAAFRTTNDAYLVQQASGAQATGSPVPAPSSSTAGPSSSAGSQPAVSGSASGSGSASSSGSTSVSGSSEATASATTSSAAPLPTGTKSVPIAAGGRASFGTPDATGALLLTGLTKRLYPGNTIKLVLTFAKAGTTTVFVPVQITELGRTAEVSGADEEAG